jgi:hypothetical protein
MYWGTAKWTPVEIFEAYSSARILNCIAPLCEYAEYHPFHREKVSHTVDENKEDHAVLMSLKLLHPPPPPPAR